MSPAPATTRPADQTSGYRWAICGLLFLATTINYIDRNVLGILAAPLGTEIGWSESQYGLIVTAFQAAYAIGLLGFGRVIDLVGTRAGYLLSIVLWSAAAAAHAFMRSALGFGVVRFFLGLGQGGNFPAAVKTVSEWFPRRERAFAIGLFNCGSNAGAIATPLLVPWLTLRFGWRWAFFVTGAIGLVWAPAWLLARRAPMLEAGHGEPAASVPWRRLLAYRETWAILIARFLTDPVWWFYLFWVPKFLNSRYGLTLDRIGLPLVIIYLAANGGSVFGGWLSSMLLKRGWTVNAARKLAILVSALMVVPMAFGANLSSLWAAVAILSLATAGHQGWAANMFASLSDMFPARAVSSVTGITGFGGAIGGMCASTAVGFILQATGSYVPAFIWAGISYLVVLALIQVMIPKIQAVAVE